MSKNLKIVRFYKNLIQKIELKKKQSEKYGFMSIKIKELLLLLEIIENRIPDIFPF